MHRRKWPPFLTKLSPDFFLTSYFRLKKSARVYSVLFFVAECFRA